LTYWPAVGLLKDTVGDWLSTRTFATVADVALLPARSVALARRS
jgi:hypothetical protein